MKLKSTLLTLILGSVACLTTAPVLASGFSNNPHPQFLRIADNSGIFSRFKSTNDDKNTDQDNTQRRKNDRHNKSRRDTGKPAPTHPGTRFAPARQEERRDKRRHERQIERRDERRDIRHNIRREERSGVIHEVIRHRHIPPIRTVKRPRLHITYPQHIRRQYYYVRGPWYYSHYIAPLPWYFYPLDYEINLLPQGYVRLVVGGLPYFYYSGVYYRPYGTGYIVVSAPIGAFVSTLPDGFIAFTIGLATFYYINDTYYVWDEDRNGYVVVEKPAGADEAIKQVTENRLIVYPPEGVDEEQQAKDRYECHRWAVGESGIDPTIEEDEFSSKDRNDYRRALAACLEGHGYTVK